MKILFTSIMLLISFIAHSQDVEVVKLNRIEEVLSDKSDTLYVVNFWATWCVPCVAELPYFEKLNEKHKDDKLKIILVTLDFDTDLESKVKPFLKKGSYKSEVWLLNESKQNVFIPKIDEMWSGAIPFTILYKGSENYRETKEGQFEEIELQEIINKNL